MRKRSSRFRLIETLNLLEFAFNTIQRAREIALPLSVSRREIGFLNHGSWLHARVSCLSSNRTSRGVSGYLITSAIDLFPSINVGRRDSKDCIFIPYSANARCVLCDRLFPFDRSPHRRFYEAGSRKNHWRNTATLYECPVALVQHKRTRPGHLQAIIKLEDKARPREN